MELGTNQRYFDALVNSLATAEDELETMETYITEENFDEFFEMYLPCSLASRTSSGRSDELPRRSASSRDSSATSS